MSIQQWETMVRVEDGEMVPDRPHHLIDFPHTLCGWHMERGEWARFGILYGAESLAMKDADGTLCAICYDVAVEHYRLIPSPSLRPQEQCRSDAPLKSMLPVCECDYVSARLRPPGVS